MRIFEVLKKVFKNHLFLFLAASFGLNFLALDYIIFSQATTFEVFFLSNTSFYIWTSIVLSAAIAVLFGIAISMVVFIFREKRENAGGAAGSNFFGGFFGAVASGCPVCGAWLLPILGIAGSLTVFPFQGLEIRALSIFLLGFSISQSSKAVLGICEAPKNKILKPLAIIAIFVLILYALPRLSTGYKINFNQTGNSGIIPSQARGTDFSDSDSLINQVNPAEGYAINAEYGNLGPQLLASGAIDLEKFKGLYERAGAPLDEKQLKILTEGLDEKIVINKDNAYFLINFFWALGLANKNPILEEGQITKYGEGGGGSFASTGGWTIGMKKTMDFYSKSEIIKLNPRQQAKLEEVANNAYRPCCGNSTAFPDCNHGMALLAALELLAANNASLDEMYEAAKYFNAFWFPRQYVDIAAYFKATEGKDFGEIDSKTIVSAQFSSGRGWSGVKKWLDDNDLTEKAPQGGGGCGV